MSIIYDQKSKYDWFELYDCALKVTTKKLIAITLSQKKKNDIWFWLSGGSMQVTGCVTCLTILLSYPRLLLLSHLLHLF